MNRRKFLGGLLKGAAVVAAAPVLVKELIKEQPWGRIENKMHVYDLENNTGAEIGWVETSEGNLWYLKNEAETRAKFQDQLEIQLMERSFTRGGHTFHKTDWDLLT